MLESADATGYTRTQAVFTHVHCAVCGVSIPVTVAYHHDPDDDTLACLPDLSDAYAHAWTHTQEDET